MYHGVVARLQDRVLDRWAISQAEFARHLDFLCASYDVISLEALVEELERGQARPETVVIVFDDAFANVYRNARPLLRDHGVSYAVAVPAALVETGRTIWSLEVQLIFLRARVPSVTVRVNDRDETCFLGSHKQRVAAMNRYLEYLRALPDAMRQPRIQGLLDQLPAGELDRLMEEFGEFKVMSSDQLRKLHAEGVGVLAHGFTHVALREGETLGVFEREVVASRRALEAIIGAPMEYFVYSYGMTCPAAVRMVRGAGYRAALTTRHGALSCDTDLFDIPRIAAECRLPHLRQDFARLIA
jgi:peptidoglycan/xylan/chitin deacetylase (PgdA/CDA1 family)